MSEQVIHRNPLSSTLDAPWKSEKCVRNESSVGQLSVQRSRAANMVAWSGLENASLALVSFLTLIVYSHFLSPSDFGLFSVVLALVEILGLLVTMLFHDALVQRPDITQLHIDTAFTFTIVLSLVLLAGCALFARTFALWVGNPATASVLIFTALCFPCAAIGATIVPLQRRRLEFRPLAVRSLAGRLAGAAVGVLLVVLGARFWGLVVQYVLMALVSSLVLWTKSSSRPGFRFRLAEFRSLLGFSLYSVGGLFLTFAIGRVFTIVVGVALGTKAAGYLNMSFRMVDVLWAIAATAVSQTALPVLARLQTDPARLKRVYAAALELICLILYPCFAGIALVAPELVEVLFGRTWLVCSPYIVVLALLIIVRSPGLLGRPLLTAVGRPQDALIGIGLEMLVMIALMLTLGVRSLPWALAIWVAREIVSIPVNAFVLKRATGIRYVDQVRGAWAPLLASACMYATVYLLRLRFPSTEVPLLRLSVFVPAGATAYLVASWLLNRGAIVRGFEFLRSAARRQGAQVAS